MDKTEQFFRKNKASFDHRTPDDTIWDNISLPKHRKRFLGLKTAAMLAVLIGLSVTGWIIFQPIKESTQKFTMVNQVPLVKNIQQLELHAPNGDKVILSPADNTFTLVQFWASTDRICTEESCYYFKPVYEKYKDKGFEIYAVSLDDNRAQWVKSIEENDLSWIHVSDLRGFDSPVCKACNIAKIPSSYLIDQHGNIIAKNIEAQDLDTKLANLYQE